MKDRKTEFHYFTIMDYEKEQEYLNKMHREGWKFTKVNLPGFYHFEKCEPEDVVYQLDYNQEGIAHKEEYMQMFRDCGWEYIMDFVGYSYFRKPASEMKEDEGIFCDDNSRLEMMDRVFRGRVIPLIIIFIAIIIPQLFFQASMHGLGSFFFIVFVLLFILYAIIFVQFGIKYLNFKNNIR